MKAELVKVLNNKVIKNSKGSVIKYVNKNNKFFNSFGEVYFSKLKKNKIKGWNYHKKYKSIITVPVGRVLFMIVDIKQNLIKKYITKKKILIIPPKHWFAFKSKSKNSIIVNLIDGIHSKKETIKSNIIKNIKIS